MKLILILLSFLVTGTTVQAQSPSDLADQFPTRSGNYGSAYGNQSGGSYNTSPQTPSDYAGQHPYRSGNYGDGYGYEESHMRRQAGCEYFYVGYQLYKRC